MAKLSFFSIGADVQMSMPLADLPSRDKVSLCRALLDTLNITHKLDKKAQEVISDQFNKAWKEVE